jgi:hypothetical protein
MTPSRRAQWTAHRAGPGIAPLTPGPAPSRTRSATGRRVVAVPRGSSDRRRAAVAWCASRSTPPRRARGWRGCRRAVAAGGRCVADRRGLGSTPGLARGKDIGDPRPRQRGSRCEGENLTGSVRARRPRNPRILAAKQLIGVLGEDTDLAAVGVEDDVVALGGPARDRQEACGRLAHGCGAGGRPPSRRGTRRPRPVATSAGVPSSSVRYSHIAIAS